MKSLIKVAVFAILVLVTLFVTGVNLALYDAGGHNLTPLWGTLVHATILLAPVAVLQFIWRKLFPKKEAKA